MIITSAPLRISLGGGGTDLPFYSNQFGGSLLSASIDKYIHIVIQPRNFYDNFLIRYSQVETPRFVEDIQHSRIREALKLLKITKPLEITSLADVPAQTGLGSSSTFLVALLKALHVYKRESVSAHELAEECFHIEHDILKEPLGKQDQYMAAYGGLQHLDISQSGKVAVIPLDLAPSTIENLEYSLAMFYTHKTRSSADVLGQQKRAVQDESSKLDYMHKIKDIGVDIRHALEENRLDDFGRAMNTHWESKKAFTSAMTNSDIDTHYALALKNGALGGKVIGAGGGGFLMFYCTDKQKLREALAPLQLSELFFRFEHRGCHIKNEG